MCVGSIDVLNLYDYSSMIVNFIMASKTVRDSYGKIETPIKYDYIDMLENKELAFGLEDFLNTMDQKVKRWIKDKPT